MNIRKLFHIDVFMPEKFKAQAIKLQQDFKQYEFSMHMNDNVLNEDKHKSHDYGEDILKSIDKIGKYITPAFEVEVEKHNNSWYVCKYCIRIPVDNKNVDAVIVIQPYFNRKTKQYDNTRNLIKTAWLNSRTDNHNTLEADKYVKKDEWK